MNLRAAADGLGLSPERMERMLGRVVRSSDWPTPRLLRFDKAVSGIEAGTVVFDDNEIVYGYPKIRRAMMLSPAIRRHFSDGVLVEEKMNGHNVRVVRVGGSVIALTRGGFICPYSTEVAKDQIPPEVFGDHPDLVLCGEMVGPKNPYVPKEVYTAESMDFYLFDVSRKGKRDMEGSQKTHAIAEEYGIRSVRLFGEFGLDDAAGEIREIIKELGRSRKHQKPHQVHQLREQLQRPGVRLPILQRLRPGFLLLAGRPGGVPGGGVVRRRGRVYREVPPARKKHAGTDEGDGGGEDRRAPDRPGGGDNGERPPDGNGLRGALPKDGGPGDLRSAPSLPRRIPGEDKEARHEHQRQDRVRHRWAALVIRWRNVGSIRNGY
jgi:hypothetical protein